MEPAKLSDAVIAVDELPFESIYNFRDVGETVNKHGSVAGRYSHPAGAQSYIREFN